MLPQQSHILQIGGLWREMRESCKWSTTFKRTQGNNGSRTSAPSILGLPGFEYFFDDRFDRVPARAWTNVPCEDCRFSDLLRLYFIIEHPIFAFVDKDLFLDDLVTGNKTFCSSLLVNSILCFAAVSQAILILFLIFAQIRLISFSIALTRLDVAISPGMKKILVLTFIEKQDVFGNLRKTKPVLLRFRQRVYLQLF